MTSDCAFELQITSEENMIRLRCQISAADLCGFTDIGVVLRRYLKVVSWTFNGVLICVAV